MRKLIIITSLILSQLICFCQTPGVNLLSDRVGINIANPNRQFEILGLDNTLDVNLEVLSILCFFLVLYTGSCYQNLYPLS
ncbi:MAG: hypothetical protein ACI86M_003149 [Saprospiraceae bacterium]|jgi:hypothetical protein